MVHFNRVSDVYGPFSNFYGQGRGNGTGGGYFAGNPAHFRIPCLSSTRFGAGPYSMVETPFVMLKLACAGNMAAAVNLAKNAHGTGEAVKALGRPPALTMSPAQVRVWDECSVAVMQHLVYCKFQHGQRGMLEMLLATGDARIEERTGRDNFWGTGSFREGGRGANNLGIALMHARECIRAGKEAPPLPEAVMVAIGQAQDEAG